MCCRPVILCLLNCIVNIFSADKGAILCAVDLLYYVLLNCIAEAVQVTKGRKYFIKGYMLVSPGIKVKQPLL